MMSHLQGDVDMDVVAYADDTNFYLQPVWASAGDVVHVCKGPFIEPVIAPSIGVNDPETLVSDMCSPVGLSAYKEWRQWVDVHMGWGPTQMLEAAI